MRLALVGLLALSSVAHAQPEAPSPEPAPVPEPEPDRDLRDDSAWTLYHGAFVARARGDEPAARTLLERVVEQYPEHPAAAAARLRLAASGRAPGDVDLLARPRGPVAEQKTQSARGELAIVQTIGGIGAGVFLCVAASCDDATAGLGLALLGGVAGATASLGTTTGGVRPGDRAAYNSGMIWGVYNGAFALVVTDPDDDNAVGGLLLGGQAIGLLAGGLIASRDPTAGQVALANSGGLWGGAVTGLFTRAFAPDLDEEDFATAMWIGADGGILAGAAVASRFPHVSRGQTLIIDAAGIVGALAGGGSGVLITDDPGSETVYGLAGAGALVGVGAAAYLTRGWGRGDDAPAVRTGVLSAPSGDGALVTAGGTF